MIKYGKAVCTNCLRPVDEWWYYIPQLNLIVKAVRNILGDYQVFPVREEDKKTYQIHITEKPEKMRGLPMLFKVEVERSREKWEFTLRSGKRICRTAWSRRTGSNICRHGRVTMTRTS